MKRTFFKNIPRVSEDENTVVEILFRGSDKETYRCAGVLMREEKNTIRVAFNAINDVVKDFLDIKKADILYVRTVDQTDVKQL